MLGALKAPSLRGLFHAWGTRWGGRRSVFMVRCSSKVYMLSILACQDNILGKACTSEVPVIVRHVPKGTCTRQALRPHCYGPPGPWGNVYIARRLQKPGCSHILSSLAAMCLAVRPPQGGQAETAVRFANERAPSHENILGPRVMFMTKNVHGIL